MDIKYKYLQQLQKLSHNIHLKKKYFCLYSYFSCVLNLDKHAAPAKGQAEWKQKWHFHYFYNCQLFSPSQTWVNNSKQVWVSRPGESVSGGCLVASHPTSLVASHPTSPGCQSPNLPTGCQSPNLPSNSWVLAGPGENTPSLGEDSSWNWQGNMGQHRDHLAT